MMLLQATVMLTNSYWVDILTVFENNYYGFLGLEDKDKENVGLHRCLSFPCIMALMVVFQARDDHTRIVTDP